MTLSQAPSYDKGDFCSGSHNWRMLGLLSVEFISTEPMVDGKFISKY